MGKTYSKIKQKFTKQKSENEVNDDDEVDIVTAQRANIWNENTKKELMNGSGTFLLKNGHKYEGEFVMGRKKGMGRFTWKNGDTFEGSHSNHDSHGYGKYTFINNGETFEGEYRKGKQNGRGTYHYKNGDVFIGNYV